MHEDVSDAKHGLVYFLPWNISPFLPFSGTMQRTSNDTESVKRIDKIKELGGFMTAKYKTAHIH